MHTLTIKPQIINKAIKVAASKSVMQRVIACAVLSEEKRLLKIIRSVTIAKRL